MTNVVPREDTQALTRDTEIAIERGCRLMNWWSQNEARLKPFQIPARDKNLVEITGFYDALQTESGQSSVMGCLQAARFQCGADSSSDVTPLNTFLRTEFASRAGWSDPGGRPAGFGYEALLCKLKETGEVQRVQNGTDPGALDFAAVGNKYEWLMLRVDLHDFVRCTPLRSVSKIASKFVKEAAYVVLHDSYAKPVGDPLTSTVAECLFGYSFLPCACERGIFGFGPGHFNSAIKQFRFSLLESGELRISVAFVVAPRSEKVLDLWGFCPVYSSVHLLDALTLGQLGVERRAHDRLDRYMLKIHGRVHHHLLNGLEELWVRTKWVAE